ncbi:MAG: hypothetical protein IKN63_03230 [Bacilli bacterium]|nr:hypothetical protein [Bacilli bacterium]
MKKILYLILILLIITGCSKELQEENTSIKQESEIVDKEEEKIEEEKYVDNNPIKIAFYNKGNGVYKKLLRYESRVVSMQEVGIFSIILSNEDEVIGSSIKSLYNSKKEEIEGFNNYKIGFNIKFTLNDGREINENILKPLGYGSYGFSPYLYAWIYDDINTTGWHSHIEETEFNDSTIMSSIKLMWGPTSNEIASDIELSVFTYDEDDFDEFGYYRGIGKYTTIIERK